MSKKLTFHCVSGRNLLTVGLPHAQYHGAELEAVLIVLPRIIDEADSCRKKSFFIKE